jgi:hypothetical protein
MFVVLIATAFLSWNSYIMDERDIEFAKGVAVFGFISALIVFHDPVLMYMTLVSFQILLFPAMSWLVMIIGTAVVINMYMSHDLVLSSEISFFLTVDKGLQRTITNVLLFILLGHTFHLVRNIIKQQQSSLAIIVNMLPLLVILASKLIVDKEGDWSIIDNSMIVFDYGKTMFDYTIKILFRSTSST